MLRKILYLILPLLLFYILLRMFIPITTTFHVTANTERVKFTTVDQNISLINLTDVNIWLENQDSPSIKNISCSIDLNEGVDVKVERIGKGDGFITIETKNSSAGRLTYQVQNSNKTIELSQFTEIDIKNIEQNYNKGISNVFSISGIISVGRKIDFEIPGESTSIMNGGEIVMVGKSYFGGNHFEAGKKNLFMGDLFQIENPIGKAFGFISIDSEPGMKIAYRVSAKKGRIIKPGPTSEFSSDGYFISASLYDQFLNDKTFQGLSILFACVLTLTTLVTFYYDSIKFISENNKTKQS